MTKEQFIGKLRSKLYWSLSAEEIEDIAGDYEGFFTVGAADGESEEQICTRLGDPSCVARELKSELRSGYKKFISPANIKTMMFAAALLIAGITACYFADIRFAGNMTAIVFFSLMMWYGLGGNLRTVPSKVRSAGMIPGKGRTVFHVMLGCLVAFIFIFIFAVIYAPDFLEPSTAGIVIEKIMFAMFSLAALAGIAGAFGVIRKSPGYFTLISHAVGVICSLRALFHLLRTLSDIKIFVSHMVTILMIYAASLILTYAFARLIKKLERGNRNGSTA